MRIGRIGRVVCFGSVLAVAAGAAGCASREAERDPPLVQQQRIQNVEMMNALPEAVSVSFYRQHPNATVTAVEPSTSGTPVYRISYVEGGAPGSVVYRADGSTVRAAQGAPVVPPPASTVP